MRFELKLNTIRKMGFELKLSPIRKKALELKLKPKVWLQIFTCLILYSIFYKKYRFLRNAENIYDLHFLSEPPLEGDENKCI